MNLKTLENELDILYTNTKSSKKQSQIIVGVGIVLTLIFLIFGITHAQNIAPNTVLGKTETRINNPQVSMEKTIPEYNFIQDGYYNKASLWTIAFYAPKTGWYKFKYWEMYNIDGRSLGLLKTYSSFCSIGFNYFPNCVAVIYGWNRGGYYFNEDVYAKFESVVLVE